MGCRTTAGQHELIRLAVDDRGRVVADPDRRLPGRGVYLHPTTECLQVACRRRAIARGLRHSGIDHEEIAARLAAGFKNRAKSR